MIKILLVLVANLLFFSDAQKSRIVGGQVAAAGQFPFLAAIYKTTADGSYFCGGSLIYSRWILTAGQCVDGGTLFTIYLGTNNIKTPSSTSVKLATEEYFLHPDYNPQTLENDLGLIKLRMNVSYSDYIKSISLPFFTISAGASLRIAGWGEINDEDGLSDELYWHQYLKTISNDECKITYGNQITDNMICLVGNYNEGICHGDTGTAMMMPYRGDVPILQGIASFVSSNGCESTDPSGFTRVYPYVEWIKNVINTA